MSTRKSIRPALKQALYRRCQGRCDFCGQRFGLTFDAHHRQQKSVGGRDHLANLVAVHRLCHDKIHDRNDYGDGWLVASHESPWDIPVKMFDGLRYLDDLGGMALVTDSAIGGDQTLGTLSP